MPLSALKKKMSTCAPARFRAFLRFARNAWIWAVALGFGAGVFSRAATLPYGLEARPQAKAYLFMPELGSGTLPPLLSQTGAFKDVRNLVPADSLIPYAINLPFWSDGAVKSRWISVPAGQTIKFAPTGEWIFPKGTVFMKHFELATDETQPGVTRRLETRLLVCDGAGGVYGVTYKWRPDNSDADLLSTSLTETVTIKTASGTRTQEWYYPSREDCLTCHNASAGLVLGVKTRQLNSDLAFPSGITDNELRAWNHAGLFEPKLDEASISAYAKLARLNDPTRSLEDRARSYLDANCAQCHRPHGPGVAYFDARYDTPLDKQGLIGGPVLLDQGVDGARVIAPHDPWRSIMLMRANTLVDNLKMPPIGRKTVDTKAVAVLQQWIESLPGRSVLAPPVISPRGGNYDKPIEVELKQNEPDAKIHYTLDGSAPTASDPIYDKPIKLTGPTVLRTKAFKPGFTKSITAQEIFIIGGG